ncbi:MAG: hypothetical protein ACRCTZ_01190 [Sarcina sp.]
MGYKLIENLGVINKKLYLELIDGNIISNNIVLTKNRAEHIDERRFGVLDKHKNKIVDTVNNPDLVILDDKHANDTVIAIKEIQSDENKRLYVVIKLVLEGNNPSYENSVMTMACINEKKYNQILRNKTILYKK